MDWIQGDKFENVGDYKFTPIKKYDDGLVQWKNAGSESFRLSAEKIVRPGSVFRARREEIPRAFLKYLRRVPLVPCKEDYSKLQNTLYLDDKNLCIYNREKTLPIIYTHTIYVKDLFEAVKEYPDVHFILVSHNSDLNVDSSFDIPDNCIHWFTTNVDIDHPRIESLPIGLENDRWFFKERKKEKMLDLLVSSLDREYINWAYLNANIATNPGKRQVVYDVFKNKAWATCDYGKNGSDFDNYLWNITNHPFVLCPDGNGIDTHRFWETLHMGNYPIVQKDNNNKYYEGLVPMLYVSDWEDVTIDLLKSQKEILDNSRKDTYEILTFTYWKDKILKASKL